MKQPRDLGRVEVERSVEFLCEQIRRTSRAVETMPRIRASVPNLCLPESSVVRTSSQKRGSCSGPNHIGPPTWKLQPHSPHRISVGGPDAEPNLTFVAPVLAFAELVARPIGWI